KLLSILYKDYLGNTREALKFDFEYKMIDYLSATNSTPMNIELQKATYFSQLIRETTGTTNFYRLTLSRLRRLFLALTTISLVDSAYNHTARTIDTFAAPFFSYLGWVFFIPRLFNNLYFTIKHLIPSS